MPACGIGDTSRSLNAQTSASTRSGRGRGECVALIDPVRRRSAGKHRSLVRDRFNPIGINPNRVLVALPIPEFQLSLSVGDSRELYRLPYSFADRGLVFIRQSG